MWWLHCENILHTIFILRTAPSLGKGINSSILGRFLATFHRNRLKSRARGNFFSMCKAHQNGHTKSSGYRSTVHSSAGTLNPGYPHSMQTTQPPSYTSLFPPPYTSAYASSSSSSYGSPHYSMSSAAPHASSYPSYTSVVPAASVQWGPPRLMPHSTSHTRYIDPLSIPHPPGCIPPPLGFPIQERPANMSMPCRHTNWTTASSPIMVYNSTKTYSAGTPEQERELMSLIAQWPMKGPSYPATVNTYLQRLGPMPDLKALASELTKVQSDVKSGKYELENPQPASALGIGGVESYSSSAPSGYSYPVYNGYKA